MSFYRQIASLTLIFTITCTLISTKVLADDIQIAQNRLKRVRFDTVQWYRLDEESSIDIVNGDQTNLSGYIALHPSVGDNEQGHAYNYLLTKMILDHTPEVLISMPRERVNIPLFGGPGVGIGSTGGSLHVAPDGTVRLFQWFLWQELDQEDQNGAIIYRRDLVIDPDQISTVSYVNEDDMYPEQIDLFLLLEDVWSSYRPKTIVSPEGETIVTAAVVPGQQRITVARVRLVLSASKEVPQLQDNIPIRKRHLQFRRVDKQAK